MIVRNESHVILETLHSVSPYIDYWVICDTGSTDDTREKIQYYLSYYLDIPGELYVDEWKDFGTNRTLALQRARGKTDYVWVIDADDIIHGDFRFPDIMDADTYMLRYGTTSFTYFRNQIFNNRRPWEYHGVLHEFSVCVDHQPVTTSKITEPKEYYIDSRRLGARNRDPEKYKKDANIMIKALGSCHDLHMKSRYTFYIAQSFMDYGELENAISWYQERIHLRGWSEEVFISHLSIATCLTRLDPTAHEKQIIEHHLRAYQACPVRMESLFMLAVYYDQKGNPDKAISLLFRCIDHPFPKECVLFLRADIYRYEAYSLLIHLLEQTHREEQATQLWKKLLLVPETLELVLRHAPEIRGYQTLSRVLSSSSIPTTFSGERMMIVCPLPNEDMISEGYSVLRSFFQFASDAVSLVAGVCFYCPEGEDVLETKQGITFLYGDLRSHENVWGQTPWILVLPPYLLFFRSFSLWEQRKDRPLLFSMIPDNIPQPAGLFPKNMFQEWMKKKQSIPPVCFPGGLYAFSTKENVPPILWSPSREKTLGILLDLDQPMDVSDLFETVVDLFLLYQTISLESKPRRRFQIVSPSTSVKTKHVDPLTFTLASLQEEEENVLLQIDPHRDTTTTHSIRRRKRVQSSDLHTFREFQNVLGENEPKQYEMQHIRRLRDVFRMHSLTLPQKQDISQWTLFVLFRMVFSIPTNDWPEWPDISMIDQDIKHRWLWPIRPTNVYTTPNVQNQILQHITKLSVLPKTIDDPIDTIWLEFTQDFETYRPLLSFARDVMDVLAIADHNDTKWDIILFDASLGLRPWTRMLDTYHKTKAFASCHHPLSSTAQNPRIFVYPLVVPVVRECSPPGKKTDYLHFPNIRIQLCDSYFHQDPEVLIRRKTDAWSRNGVGKTLNPMCCFERDPTYEGDFILRERVFSSSSEKKTFVEEAESKMVISRILQRENGTFLPMYSLESPTRGVYDAWQHLSTQEEACESGVMIHQNHLSTDEDRILACVERLLSLATSPSFHAWDVILLQPIHKKPVVETTDLRLIPLSPKDLEEIREKPPLAYILHKKTACFLHILVQEQQEIIRMMDYQPRWFHIFQPDRELFL